MSKKISEWLKELPMPYREMALTNYANSKLHDIFLDSMPIALSRAFDWAASEEGFSYWNDVFNRLVTGDLSTGSNGECDIKKQLDEVTKQRDDLIKSIRSFQTDFEAIRWGYDGDCGSARLADILFWNLIAAVKGGEG